MNKKRNADAHGFVYSTNPNFQFETNANTENITLLPSEQKLTVLTDNKHRGGKVVTIVENFVGNETALNDLCKQLKAYCGTGGSAKNGIILIQGNQKEKIYNWLLLNGFTKTKKK
jgi:translation initiation factor 1